MKSHLLALTLVLLCAAPLAQAQSTGESIPADSAKPNAATATPSESIWSGVFGKEHADLGNVFSFASAAQSASSLAGLGVSSMLGVGALGGVVGILYNQTKKSKSDTKTQENTPLVNQEKINEVQFGGSKTNYQSVEKY